MSITQASPQDAGCISRIHAASWKAGYKGLVCQEYLDSLSEDHWTAIFTKRLAGTSIQAKLAWEGETAVGAVAYGDYLPPTGADTGGIPGGGYVLSLYIHPDYMGRGYGAALLRAAEEALGARGFESCFLYVLDTNLNARAFYEMQGYAWDGFSLPCLAGEQPLTDLRYIKALAGR